MPKKTSSSSGKRAASTTGAPVPRDVPGRVAFALDWLQKASTQKDRDNLARFGITANDALGVSMANIQRLAKLLGKDHALACALWDTGCYEARMLVSFVGEPSQLTAKQMDAWCREFDNWAICDTLCFHLFDRSPAAWDRIAAWRTLEAEQGKRAAFALLASIAGHDRSASDELFIQGLQYIEAAASDDRNFVKKGIDWALRRIGSRNANLNRLALATAQRLAASSHPGARWIGKTSARELGSDKALARFAGTKKATTKKATTKKAATKKATTKKATTKKRPSTR
jgi:3-methyladenine DNA glycosylase AlkD